jgi:NAD(P)-dependent dehydrogenase (short-subunit alcohol dehydrogenase family)
VTPTVPRRTAVVTGASRGLGSVLSGFLAAEGFDLVLTARDADALARRREELERLGGAVVDLPGDVTDPGLRSRLQSTVDQWGGLDLLVNNAAILGPTPLPALAEARLEDLEQVYRVNVAAPLALIQALRPPLARRKGLVVNISSDAAVGGYSGWGNYGSSKAALDLVSLTLANELGPMGIAVVAVDPGDMQTPGARPAFPPEEFAARPMPDVTLPFWAWLLGQPRSEVTGRRFRAQADHWGASP